jgi:hypothetical protein
MEGVCLYTPATAIFQYQVLRSQILPSKAGRKPQIPLSPPSPLPSKEGRTVEKAGREFGGSG